MSRVRADDYDLKQQSILESAAALFAGAGYPSAKMQDIAKACGATKSMLYHYFPTKDHILQALLSEHLERLIADVERALHGHGTAKQRFAAFVRVHVQKSAQSRQRHVTAMNDLKFLPARMQKPILKLERQLIDQIAELLRELNPGLPNEMYKPYTMLLLGMLNWTDLWYKPDGRMNPEELCARISRLFTRGFLAEKKEDFGSEGRAVRDLEQSIPS
jgi:AcrR family transcriptional regulator